MAVERRRRADLGAFVNATSTEHEDKFCGHRRRIQSVECLVRINQITTTPTSALVLMLSFHPRGVAFSAPRDS